MANTPQTIDPRRGATSASNALADSLCPGRHLAGAGLPDVPGEYAASGSRIHAALADAGKAAALSLAERETFDACMGIEQKLVAQYFGVQPPPMKVFREQRFWAKFKAAGATIEVEHSGQPDVVYRAGVKALICEYKTLAGEVPESSRNLQLRDQAVLVRGNFVPTEEIAVAVIQPLVTHSPEICVYDKAALDHANHEMFQRVLKSNDPRSPRVAGEVQCKYCRAKSGCLAYSKWTEGLLPVPLPIVGKPMATWTGEDCAAFCNGLSTVLKFCDDGKEFIKAKLEADPSSVPGWTLKPGANRETIKDPQEVFNRFVKLGGTVEQFMLCVAVAKGKLKEALAVVTGGKGKALDGAVKTVTEGLVEVSQTAPSLMRVKEGK